METCTYILKQEYVSRWTLDDEKINLFSNATYNHHQILNQIFAFLLLLTMLSSSAPAQLPLPTDPTNTPFVYHLSGVINVFVHPYLSQSSNLLMIYLNDEFLAISWGPDLYLLSFSYPILGTGFDSSTTGRRGIILSRDGFIFIFIF